MAVTAQMYGQFLVNTPVNVTATFFADMSSGFAHDQVTRFLAHSKLSSRIIRDKALANIPLSPHGFVLFDDTVIDKDFSREIEMARTQYSGNAHGIVRGIGIVTCVYYNQDVNRFYVLMDSWYAVKQLMVHIDDLGKVYYCPVKSNRLVDDTGNPKGGKRAYKPVSELQWDQTTLEHGKLVKVKGFPGSMKVKLCIAYRFLPTGQITSSQMI